MFDGQANQHAELLDQIGKSFHKHVSGIVTIDCSQVGWAASGSGSESGRFDYEGNGLIILPQWMRANDLQQSSISSIGSRLSGGAKLYVFMNTKDNPGLPFSIDTNSVLGEFGALCCSFKRFYVYVSTAAPQGGFSSVIHLGVLKGLDLSGCGNSFKSSANEIVGCYGA